MLTPTEASVLRGQEKKKRYFYTRKKTEGIMHITNILNLMGVPHLQVKKPSKQVKRVT